MPSRGKLLVYFALTAVIFFALGVGATLLIKEPVSAPRPTSAEAASTSQGVAMGEHCRVTYKNIDPKWAPAYAKIFDTAFQGYKDIFGYSLPDPINIDISVTGDDTRLWTDGSSSIFLQLKSEDDLLPTNRYKNVYGMCHEPGHIFMYSGLSSLAGLPEGVGEGWAHYCGSVICDYVWKKLGKSAYPIPFDYSNTGTARLEEQCKEKDKDATSLAACAFYEIGKKYGNDLVGKAMMQALKDKPTGGQLMPRFADALAQMTEPSVKSMLPGDIMVSKLRWDSKRLTKGTAPPSKLFLGLKKGEGGWLYYDDGANEGMRSIAGGGHAVLFRKPGGGTLTAVRLMGSRYGPDKSDSVFRVTVLDASFKTIKQVEFPYMKFAERGEKLYWVELKMPDIKVPDAFFVAFDFSPGATDGIYVGIDEGSQGHSYTAVPDDYISDFDKGDWMIRAQVK